MPDEGTTVHFDSDIYDSSAVQTARDAYSTLMNVQIDNSNPGHIQVYFSSDGKAAAQDLIDAFCNHALFETIQRYRREGR